tara:strand:- start:11330 stop:13114 length:1785 start_codon:yes stop_codon:yes gene_type:complete
MVYKKQLRIMSKDKENIIFLLKRLWLHISKKRHIQLSILFILMVFSSIAEIISIGSVIPFLGILTSPEQFFNNDSLQPAINFFNFKSADEVIWPLTLLFISATIFAGGIRLFLVFVSTKLSFATGHDLSIDVYNRTLYQPFHVHIDRNSSEVVNGVATKTDLVIFNIILPFLNFLSSIVMVFLITVALIVLNPLVAFSVIGGIGFIYLLLIKLSTFKLLGNSQKIADKSTVRIKSLQEGIGGIRDILLSGTQELYCNLYKEADLPLRRAQANNAFISLSPRYAMEALGMILIASVAFYFTVIDTTVESIIPLLGALALGAQRMLPMLQLAYAGWSTILGGKASLVDILEFLDQKIPQSNDEVEINFDHEICFKDITFRYQEDQMNILENINIDIPKGSCVGFIGKTGSGKSTMLDILMGLLLPTSGELIVDGKTVLSDNLRSWQKNISHVPQDIFLSDNTIIENIAFGIPFDQIDINKVHEAVSIAQLRDVINELPKKYDTLVGERGVRLSGGQKQRIGIARSLYSNSKIMILDEATSALDEITERKVIDEISKTSSDITLLMIAHRTSTLKNCDFIVELADKGINRILDYKEL